MKAPSKQVGHPVIASPSTFTTAVMVIVSEKSDSTKSQPSGPFALDATDATPRADTSSTYGHAQSSCLCTPGVYRTRSAQRYQVVSLRTVASASPPATRLLMVTVKCLGVACGAAAGAPISATVLSRGTLWIRDSGMCDFGGPFVGLGFRV